MENQGTDSKPKPVLIYLKLLETQESELETKGSLICNIWLYFDILSEIPFQRLHFKRCPALSLALPNERSHTTLFFKKKSILFGTVSKTVHRSYWNTGLESYLVLSEHDEIYWRYYARFKLMHDNRCDT